MPTPTIRYVIARQGRRPQRLTYPTHEMAQRWADDVRERVVPVRVRRISPFADAVEPLDDVGAAALEGVFCTESEFG